LFNYSKLSKRNLTALVVATSMIGCVMAPVASFDPHLFAACTLGTTLTSAAANTFNQFLEVPYDSQMNRTKDRVLVRGDLTPLHAFTFASATACLGLGTLYFGVNPLTCCLGGTTLFLYTVIYTPMKRLSALNTWVGSLVGAIPPIMGYTALTGYIDPAGLLLGAILYSWQFPHFHALSWNLRAEYSRAGYRMIAVINPRVCTSSSLVHTIGLTFMCSYLAPVLELTTWNFAYDSLPFNLYFVYLAFQFKHKADAKSSRQLFRYSLAYLPLIMLLMLITKMPIKSDQKDKNLS
jgi:protoheme IX farnesyltransferase